MANFFGAKAELTSLHWLSKISQCLKAEGLTLNIFLISITSNDKYKVGYLHHGVMLTEATGNAEGVVWDGGELGHWRIFSLIFLLKSF